MTVSYIYNVEHCNSIIKNWTLLRVIYNTEDCDSVMTVDYTSYRELWECDQEMVSTMWYIYILQETMTVFSRTGHYWVIYIYIFIYIYIYNKGLWHCHHDLVTTMCYIKYISHNSIIKDWSLWCDIYHTRDCDSLIKNWSLPYDIYIYNAVDCNNVIKNCLLLCYNEYKELC